jgi:hypothetical protein
VLGISLGLKKEKNQSINQPINEEERDLKEEERERERMICLSVTDDVD